MWRSSSGDASSRRHGGRHVRFVQDNDDHQGQDSRLESASLSVSAAIKARGRIHSHLPARTTRSQSKNRRPWYALAVTTGNSTTVKEQHRQTTMQLAAEEIERLLRDEANTGNADQMVDTTDDDYNDDYDYDDNYDQEYPQTTSTSTARGPANVAPDHARDTHSGTGTIGPTSPSSPHLSQTPIQAQALPHWSLRRRRSLPTLSRRSRSSTYPQGSAPPPSLDRPTSPTRNGGTPLEHSAASDELTEQDVNAYGLFDSAGADEARMRYQRHLQLQLQRRRQQQQQERGASRCTSTSLVRTLVGASLFPDDTTAQTSGVIYDQKKYGPSIPFFTPILLALTTIFCVLVVVRLLVSLLTLAVGWLVVILLTIRLVHQILHRPVHLIRLVHSRPLLSWTFIGALVGMAHICCTRMALLLHKVTTLPLHHHHPEEWIPNVEQSQSHIPSQVMDHHPNAQCLESPFDYYPFDALQQSVSLPWDVPGEEPVPLTIEPLHNSAMVWNMTLFYTNYFSNVFSMEQDLVLIWGMLEGIVYGIQIGILWHCLLGSSLYPSKLSQWIYTNIWCFARSHYRECIRHRQQAHLLQALHRTRQQQQELLLRRRHSNSQVSLSSSLLSSSSTTWTDNDKKQCMICLEEFTTTSTDDNDEQSPILLSSLYRRYYLRCHHSFHFCCIQQWLEIKQSCPVCRISLLDTTTSSTWDRTNSSSPELPVLLFPSRPSVVVAAGGGGGAIVEQPNSTGTTTATTGGR